MTKFLCSAVFAATLALACDADSVLATSADIAFRLDTTGPAYSVSSQDAVASMNSCQPFLTLMFMFSEPQI